MILTEKKYRAERGKTAETYQGFTATVEMENNRYFIIVELDNLSRWRSREEWSSYMRWCSEEILKLPDGK
jgi:protein tyrosine phosphatase